MTTSDFFFSEFEKSRVRITVGSIFFLKYEKDYFLQYQLMNWIDTLYNAWPKVYSSFPSSENLEFKSRWGHLFLEENFFFSKRWGRGKGGCAHLDRVRVDDADRYWRLHENSWTTVICSGFMTFWIDHLFLQETVLRCYTKTSDYSQTCITQKLFFLQ